MMRVYASGPISGLLEEESQRRFFEACKLLEAAGYQPVNPMLLDMEGSLCRCGASHAHTWACYLRRDILALLECDGILMLPGWESSHGARLELTVASCCGLQVRHLLNGVIM